MPFLPLYWSPSETLEYLELLEALEMVEEGMLGHQDWTFQTELFQDRGSVAKASKWPFLLSKAIHRALRDDMAFYKFFQYVAV